MNNYLKEAGSILVLFATSNRIIKFDTDEEAFMADANALRSDWESIMHIFDGEAKTYTADNDNLQTWGIIR